MYKISNCYDKKLSRIPAATALPITPATFGPMACISKWLVLSYSNPTTCETLALSGTAETPAFPISGLILLPSLRNKLRNLTNSTPPVVAITNDAAPRIKIKIDFGVKNVVA
jgi:hypothetical protein